jgi:hypothetical protein
LFSGEELTDEFIGDLRKLFDMDESRIRTLLQTMIDRARRTDISESEEKEMARKVGVDEKTLSDLLDAGARVVSRILSGKSGVEVTDDFIARGFPETKVLFFFSEVKQMPMQTKRELRTYAIKYDLDLERWIEGETETDVRGVFDNGNIVALAPTMVLRLKSRRWKEKENSLVLELTISDVKELLDLLQRGKIELEKTTEELKSRLTEEKIVGE